MTVIVIETGAELTKEQADHVSEAITTIINETWDCSGFEGLGIEDEAIVEALDAQEQYPFRSITGKTHGYDPEPKKYWVYVIASIPVPNRGYRAPSEEEMKAAFPDVETVDEEVGAYQINFTEDQWKQMNEIGEIRFIKDLIWIWAEAER